MSCFSLCELVLALNGPVLLHGGVGVLDELLPVVSIVIVIGMLLLARRRGRGDGDDEHDQGS